MREQTFEKLYSLKLHGFAQALEEQFKNPDMSSLSFDDRLAGLVDAQWLWRENRAAATRLRKARLKQPASMEDINYRHQRQLDKPLMRSLASCDWVKQHHNITISGASGLGKTYLCCALLEQACRKGHTAYYASAPKFFRQLAVGYADGSFDRLLSKLAKIDVLGVDDWGLTPLSEMERRHFLEVMDDRGGSRSTILTSQFPVENWHDLIGNPTLADAVMERILSNSYRLVLSGDSIRQVKKPLQAPSGKEGA
jgi:DNA replication protein DnaC